MRHSVFIVGEAGTGKSQIWKTLIATYIQQERKPLVYDLNPKCVSNNELFGCINSATREWKDGLLSSLIRDQAKYANDNPKWICLDGDIDPMHVSSSQNSTNIKCKMMSFFLHLAISNLYGFE